MQSEIPKSSELDETNCNILDLRVGEEEFDRTYDFIQQKQLTPFFQSMQQINAAADAFTGHLKPMLDKLYKILEEN
jgi:hypothetical protein